MTAKIFIDGAHGTTGLQIQNLLKPFTDSAKAALISIPDYKNADQRRAAFEQADLSILCLPDAAAREAMALMNGTKTKVLDASSAHRTDANWAFGFPELDHQQDAIRAARLVTNPGCYATGAIAILRPLVAQGLINPEDPAHITGLSGYTGGGKSMIERYEKTGGDFKIANVVGAYSLHEQHKHVKEIKKHAGLTTTPVFQPYVVNVPRGMIVSIAFNTAAVNGTMADVQAAYESAYHKPESYVRVMKSASSARRLTFEAFVQLNKQGAYAPPLKHLDLHVSGWIDGDDEQITVHALLDNLGKGAGTQAIQNMRLMLDL